MCCTRASRICASSVSAWTGDGLRGKHIEALAKDWYARGLSASTLHNNLSIFRTFAEWIGKAGMVRDIQHYLEPGVTTRSSIAREDKSWAQRGVDVTAKIKQVRPERCASRVAARNAEGLRAASSRSHAASSAQCRPRGLPQHHSRHQGWTRSGGADLHAGTTCAARSGENLLRDAILEHQRSTAPAIHSASSPNGKITTTRWCAPAASRAGTALLATACDINTPTSATES